MASVCYAMVLATMMVASWATEEEVPEDYRLTLIQTKARMVVSSSSSRATDGDASDETPLNLGNLIQNNLNGLGPDSGEAEMRFGGVTQIGGQSVDMVITAGAGFEQTEGQASNNGFLPSSADAKICKIMQSPGASYALQFRFEDVETKFPVSLHKFALTFLDIDGNDWQSLKETLKICGAESARLSSNTRLEKQIEEGCFSFTPVLFTGAENPTDPASLNFLQSNHAVTVVFEKTSSFAVTSSLTDQQNYKEGKKSTRPLLFAGIAAIAAPPTAAPTPAPTDGPLECPDAWTQVGPINADVSGCGYENCDQRYGKETMEECAAWCNGKEECKSFTWAPLGGDTNHVSNKVCSIFKVDTHTGIAGPNQLMCKKPPLECPDAWTQVGPINADVGGCGYENCDQRYGKETMEECAAWCNGKEECKSFTWAPLGGDENHVSKTVCSIFKVDTHTGIAGPNQLMCKKPPQ